MAKPLLTSADVASIREFLRQYQEYRLVWAERVAEGVIARTRKPKSVLRCTDPDLRNQIKKYEMGEGVEEFNSETLMAHLMEKVAAATQAVSLKDVLGNLSFDAGLTDPKKKVGKVFQYVDKVILLNGIEGVFPVKEIATQIVKAVQPVELRRRVEYELSTIAGKEITKDLVQLYNFLVTKYAAWYELFPTGFINLAGSKAGAVKPGASPSKMKCFNCQKVGHRAADYTAAKKERNSGAEAGRPAKAAGRKCFKCPTRPYDGQLSGKSCGGGQNSQGGE